MQVKNTCGVRNISFGMPLRSVLNQEFATLLIQAGINSAIINRGELELQGIMMGAETVFGKDRRCLNFSQPFRTGRIGPKKGS
ncbi:MAG: hypothetical protein ACLP5H_06665 [Desulfomonilaceae bacterium]